MDKTIYGATTATPTPLGVADQTYNPESINAQSGKAVAEALADVDLSAKQDKFADVVINKNTVTVDANKELRIEGIETSLSLGFDVAKLEADYEVYIHAKNGNVNVDGNRIRNLADPIFDADAVNKQYMDAAIGDIESTLDSIIAIQENLMGGDGE